MKKWVEWICAAALLLTMNTAFAAETKTYTAGGVVKTGTVEEGISNDAALEGFFERAFKGGEAGGRPGKKNALRASQGSRLTGQDAQVYAFLFECVSEVAAGNRSSTVFEMPVADVLDQLSYTPEELGVEAIFVDDAINDEAVDAIYAKFTYNVSRVMNALLLDCPYELYWFDKSSTGGYSYGYPGLGASSGPSGESIYFADDAALYFDMKVAKEYSVSNAYGTTDFNTGVADSIIDAAQNASDIVFFNRTKSDYEKLKAYKNAICDRVSYNDDAADDTTETAYGNPWQLIWVFDNDAATNVVCEGYSKAFMFLCDKTSFLTDVSAALATGQMDGGTGAGPHMWNIVTMGDGMHYLVDVTNCDSGTIGAPDYLFMAGYVSRNGNTYSYAGAHDSIIHYTYDSTTVNMYSAEELDVSSTAFDPDAYYTENMCGRSVIWQIEGNTLRIRGFGDMYDFDVNAHSAPWRESDFSAVIVEDGVESVGSCAFNGCENLSSVTLSDSVKRIGDYAFQGCASLLEIELPQGMEALGDGAFCNAGLTRVIVPEGTETRNWYFYEPNANDGNPRLYSLSLPTGITDANQHAPFLGTDLPSMVPDAVPPSQLTDIEAEAFANTAPAFVWLTDGVSSIGNGAFADCTNLLFVRIPHSCHSIGDHAFQENTVLLVELGDDAYDYAINQRYDYVLYVDEIP